ncbi:hypothetical protein FJ250_05470 [bacterium]|nr:hypothetical protein [bacterium]
MRKLILIALLATVAAAPALAVDYSETKYYGHVQVIFPSGDWSDFAKLGFGPGVGMVFKHTETMAIGLEASYLMFSLEDIPGADISWSMIPVLAVGHYHLENSSAYLLGGLGLAFASSKIDFAASNTHDIDDSESELAITFGAGINATPKMFFEGRFNAISDANSLGLHMGMRF